MTSLLQPPPPFLPGVWLNVNLFDVFLVYVVLAFVASVLRRIGLYLKVYRIAKFFASSCPNIFQLLNRHLMLLIQNGILPILFAYGAVFLIYWVPTRVVFPGCSLTVADFATEPGWLTFAFLFAGATIAVDAVLVFQVGKIDVTLVVEELKFAEGWLGGRINRAMDLLGKWNPIRLYADSQTRTALREFNQLFRYSLALMLFQITLRCLLVVYFLATYIHFRGRLPPIPLPLHGS